MLQTAFRRLLVQQGSGLQQAAQAAAASGTGARFGAEYSSESSGNSRFFSTGVAFQPNFHLPSFLSNKGSSDDAQTAPGQRHALFNGLASSAAMPFAARGYHAVRQLQQQAPMCSLPATRRSAPLGLGGLGLPLRPSPVASAVQARSIASDGELLGAAYLLTTDIMFWSGLIGAVAFRRNILVMLLCTEIVMLACNMNFLFASAYLNDMTGVIMSITITTIAACETAIGLALCVTYFHIRSATDVEALNLLK